jgi:hypothetical protein
MSASEPMLDELNREPPLDADVSLEGYFRIDLPFRWQWEEWFLELSDPALGVQFRLFLASCGQIPAGSLPRNSALCSKLIGGRTEESSLEEALVLWLPHSDGRRYWPPLVPLIEEAWARKRGKQSKEAERKRRERLAFNLRKLGLSDEGSNFREVQDAVIAHLSLNGKWNFEAVKEAVQAANILPKARST